MKHRLMGLIAAGLVILTGWYAVAQPAAADSTIVVTTTVDAIADDGQCSLREAIIAANSNSAFHDCPAGSGNDTLTFDAGLPNPAVFNLTLTGSGEDSAMTGDLDIVGSAINTLTINGQGQDSTIIDGNGADRVLDIQAGARASISDITVRYGNPGGGSKGGGIALRSTGRLTLNDSRVISNTAASGGGIHVLGGLTLNNSTIEANSGGGVTNEGGLLTFTGAQLVNNSGGYAVDNQLSGYLSFSGGSVIGNSGGGILNENSTAELDSLQIVGNLNGGGVHSQGSSKTTLTLTSSAVMSNTATTGGGVLSEGIAASSTIENSRISFNSADSGGGGIANNAVMAVKTSVVYGNQARSGGGIDNAGPSLTLTNVTLHANSASDNGGGLHNRKSASLTNVTISNNGASGADTGGNIFNDGDTAGMALLNTVVAQPSLGSNCTNSIGVVTSLGYNLDSGDTCGFSAVGDQVNTDPLLGPLQDNGGPTFTQALLTGSPGIDHGKDEGCPATDQRGVSRPQGSACDIGAFEFALTADLSAGKLRLGSGPVSAGQPVTYTITISNAGPTTPITATVVDTWSPPSAVVAARAPNCTVDLVTGTAICQVVNLGLGSTVVPAPHLVLTTSGSFSGTLINVAQVSPNGGIIDLTPGNDTSPTVFVNVVAPPSHGVSLSPDDAKSGAAGQSVLYTLTLTNTGNVADTFDLTLSGNNWPSSLSTPSVNLGPAATTTFNVTVGVPANALGGNSDGASVMATSQGDGSKSDSALLTTTVAVAHGVALSSGYALSGAAGGSVTYTLPVTNTGNVADTFNLSLSANSWPTELSTPSVNLGPAATTTFSVTVDVPANALGGDSDLVLVSATSVGAGSKSDSALLTTSVTPISGIILSKDDSLTGRPGTTVTYTLWITNSGNVTDTFDIQLAGNLWSSVLSTASKTLAAGEQGSVSVAVEIPYGAAHLEYDAVTVRAVSRSDGTKSDTAVLTTFSRVFSSTVHLPIVLGG